MFPGLIYSVGLTGEKMRSSQSFYPVIRACTGFPGQAGEVAYFCFNRGVSGKSQADVIFLQSFYIQSCLVVKDVNETINFNDEVYFLTIQVKVPRPMLKNANAWAVSYRKRKGLAMSGF